MPHLNSIEDKIMSLEELLKSVSMWRLNKSKVVFTNGCFDFLHKGHIEYLARAADIGSHLVVGLNSDESVKKLGKGSNRPLQDESSRALVVASLKMVDAVCIFDEETPYELIKSIQPDVLVKGGDWHPEDIVGSDVVLNAGGEVSVIELTEGYSTSSIEQRILDGKS